MEEKPKFNDPFEKAKRQVDARFPETKLFFGTHADEAYIPDEDSPGYRADS